MPAKFVLSKDKAGKFRFNLVASNGQVVATSQAYGTRAAANNGISSVRKNAPVAEVDDQTVVAPAAPAAPAAATAVTAVTEAPAAEAPAAAAKPAKKAKAAKKGAAKATAKRAAKKSAKKG